MSKEVLEQVILKASSDARFRGQLSDNFESAIRPYDLTGEEKEQLKTSMSGQADAGDREVDRNLAASNASTNLTQSNAQSDVMASSNASTQLDH